MIRGEKVGMKQPKTKNNIEKPVNIYKNGILLKECKNIQEAGRVLKEVSEDINLRFSHIERGYLYGNSWSYNGATYTFTTDETFRVKRIAELEEKNKKLNSN